MHRPQINRSAVQQPGIVITNGLLQTYPAFAFLAYIHSAFDGVAGTTQLIDGYSTNSIVGTNTANTWALDNYVFYPIKTNGLSQIPVIAGADGNAAGPNNLAAVGDDPKITCVGATVMHYDLMDYVRFCPGAPNPNIFVTLGTIKWHVYGTAMPETSGYVLSGPSASADPSVGDSMAFPVWTNTVFNYSQ
jgi:hypothetical protein